MGADSAGDGSAADDDRADLGTGYVGAIVGQSGGSGLLRMLFHVWGVYVPDAFIRRTTLDIRARADGARVLRWPAFRVCRQSAVGALRIERFADRVRVVGVFRIDGLVQDHCFEGSILGSVRIGCVLLDLSVASIADLRRAVDCGRVDVQRASRSGADHSYCYRCPARRLSVRGAVHVDRRDVERAAGAAG